MKLYKVYFVPSSPAAPSFETKRRAVRRYPIVFAASGSTLGRLSHGHCYPIALGSWTMLQKVPGLRFPGPSGSHLTARLRCVATCLAECYRIRAVTQIEDLDSSAKRRAWAAWLEPLSSWRRGGYLSCQRQHRHPPLALTKWFAKSMISQKMLINTLQ